jgi:hypothetical protein
MATSLSACIKTAEKNSPKPPAPEKNKIDTIKEAMEVIGRDNQGRLANIMAYRLKTRGAPTLSKSDINVVDAVHQQMMNDFTEDRYYKNMKIFGYQDEMIKHKEQYILRGKWALDAEKGSVFEKAFPRGANLAFHEESIPKNPNCSKPVVILGELYPKNSKPLGVTVNEEPNGFRIIFDKVTPAIYQHRALLDIGCLVRKDDEKPVTTEN